MTKILCIICIALTLVIYYQLYFYSEQVDTSSLANVIVTESERQHHDKSLENKPISHYSEIIERPLFAIDRLPNHSNTTVIKTSINIDELEDLIIYGIVKTSDDSYVIIGNTDSQKDAQKISLGGRYKGWLVTEITSDSVKFKNDDDEYELIMLFDE